MKTDDYVRYTYWITSAQAERLARILKEEHGIRLRKAGGVVCTPLAPRSRVTLVTPQAWNRTCARQGSWYRTSSRAGLSLAVSPEPLEGFGFPLNTCITLSSERVTERADPETKLKLVESRQYKSLEPSEWRDVLPAEKKRFLAWARKRGVTYDFEELFLTHSANHANFIDPLLFMEEGDAMIPYSIDRSAALCSCCLELYNVLGYKFPKKLVALCSGAVAFSRLPEDVFLEVRTTQQNDD